VTSLSYTSPRLSSLSCKDFSRRLKSANPSSKFINAALVDASGKIGAMVCYFWLYRRKNPEDRPHQVNYLGETQVFTSTQLVDMYLGKLRDIAADEFKEY
jgi:heat shock 70kDa protein 4